MTGSTIKYLLLAGLRSLLVILAVGMFAPPAHAGPIIDRIQTTRTLRVGVNPQFWPFSYTEADERRGVDIDIARLLADEMGVALTIVGPPRFTDLFSMAATHQVDVIIAGMSRTFKRATIIDFSMPYFHTGVAILLNRQTAADVGIADADSYEAIIETLRFLNKADQLKVIVAADKAPADSVRVFFDQAQIIPIDAQKGTAKCIEALDRGKGHLFVHDLISLKHWAATHPAQSFKLHLIEPPYKKDTYGFGVAKGNLDLVQMLNIFIESKLVHEGHMGRFMSEHYKVE